MRSLRIARPFAALAVASALALGQAAPPSPAPAPKPAPRPAPRDVKPDPAHAREAAVVAVLARELDGRCSNWFWGSTRAKPPDAKGARGRLVIPATCGTGIGELPATRAQDLIGKLGAVYGAKCDLAVDVKQLPAMGGETFTSLACVAADAVARLNEVCDGEDVDLSLLFAGALDRWPLPPARDGAGRVVAAVVAGGSERFESAKRIRFEFRPDAPGAGAATRGRKFESDGALRSTVGHVALLEVPIHPTTDLAGTGMPDFSARVAQADVAASSSSEMVWLPSTFDAKKPFTVDVALGAGVWTFGNELLVTAPER